MTNATIAKTYLTAGLSVLPASKEQKRPTVPWKPYQTRLPTNSEIEAWFANEHDAVCLICGKVSGNLELLDFDCQGEKLEAWHELVDIAKPGLVERLVLERSQSGGWHVIYRCETPVAGNLKLAQRREDTDGPDEVMRFGKTYKPRQDKAGKWHIVLTTIETRGEGGLFLCAPTPWYVIMQGKIEELPVITAEERDALLSCAARLDELPAAERIAPEPERQTTGPMVSDGIVRPGDEFNRQADIHGILQKHGWILAHDGHNQHWTRPGKDSGTSATLKDGCFYVFSSNAAPFEPNKSYNAFAVFALLEHNGDFAAAAKALRQAGFGGHPQEADISRLLAKIESGTIEATVSQQIAMDITKFSETPPKSISWIWKGVIPMGMLSLIGGKGGVGKSFVVSDLAARVSTGSPMPDGSQCVPGKVLLLAREDDASCVLLPRLKAAKANLEMVHWSVFQNAATEKPMDLIDRIDMLIEAALVHEYRMIVVDTFAAFAPVGTDANAAQDVRLLLDALTRLARATGAAVVVVAHLRKTGQGEGDPMDAIAGSAQMTAGVRVAALLDKGIGEGEKWFRVVKTNLGGASELGWVWKFAWDDPFGGQEIQEVPHLEWSDAGEEYREQPTTGWKASGKPTAKIDGMILREIIRGIAIKGPRGINGLIELAWATAQQSAPKTKKADVEVTIEDMLSGGSLASWPGDRGARIVGLPGSKPAPKPDPVEVATRLAMADTGQTVRALKAAAGCSTDVAAAALRKARELSCDDKLTFPESVPDPICLPIRAGTVSPEG